MSHEPTSSIVRHSRHTQGLTQCELAECVGVSQSYIANVERARFMPSPDVAKRLGKVLGFPWYTLYGD